MTTLLTTLISNSIFVIPLAIVAMIATRFIRHPTVHWAIWGVVLLKFVTPAFVALPLNDFSKSNVPTWIVDSRDHRLNLSAVTDSLGSMNGPHQKNDAHAGIAMTIQSAESIEEPARNDFSWWPWTFRLSLVGSGVFLLLAIKRLRQFRRLIVRAEPADPRIVSIAKSLAKELRLKTIPDIRVTPGKVPPVLMAGLKRTTILLPRELVASIDEEAQRTLLAHELSHFVRRDHWVRWLEFAVRCLYWWHPVAWLAGRGMREAEEQCCDARVVSLLPNSVSTYARTILATIDYCADDPTPVPVLATGIKPLRRSVRPLHRRISMICDKNVPRRLSFIRCAVLLSIATFVLPLSLFAEGTTESPDDREADVLSDFGLHLGSAETSPQRMAAPETLEEISVVGRDYEVNADVGRAFQTFLKRMDSTFPVLATTMKIKETKTSFPGAFSALTPKPSRAVLRVTAPKDAQLVIGAFINSMNQEELDAVQADEAILARGDYEMTSEGVDQFVQLLKTYQDEEVIKPLLVRQDGRKFKVTTYNSIHKNIGEFIQEMGKRSLRQRHKPRIR